jgi:hypothetical protein
MEIMLVTMGVFLGAVLVMSVGVIFKRKPIQGSCGGIANIMGKAGCDICEMKSECADKFKKEHSDCHEDECHS